MNKVKGLEKERGNANYTSSFENVERILAEMRLACMQAIFHDFEYADSKKIEGLLWSAHTYMNTEYRNIIGRLVAQNQVVQKRKLEKLYRDFMKTSQSFYRAYIQRLSGRFYIAELRQAAQHLELDPTETPLRDASVPQPLREMLVKSCHSSLNHLGDLSRYRCQASDKFSKTAFETALAYYCLANIVDPDDGTAHHQMAVLYRLPGQHLDIVYHFHRSISIAKPHQLALENLEKEYRTIRTSQNTRRPSGKNPSEALITWFVRLHAFYFEGNTFSQQKELEEEVLHRLELALKPESSDAALLKIILINIAAYDVAKTKITQAWTANASRHCQYVLLFTVRNIRILLRLVKETLQEDHGHLVEPGKDSGESPLGFGSVLMNLLPLLRIYLAWMYSLRADLVEYRIYLEDHITEVYRLLADVLTLLNTFVAPAAITVRSQYLLPEDTETMGLSPLNDQSLPLFLHTQLIEGSDVPEMGRVRKPTRQVLGRQHEPHTEAVWRIRDIIYCGALLASTPEVPLGLVSQSQNGESVEMWTYTDEPKTSGFVDEAGIDHILCKLDLRDVNGSIPGYGTPQQSTPVVATADVQDPGQPAPGPGVLDGALDAPPSLEAGQMNSANIKVFAPVCAPDLSEDSEMVAMVNNLVDPTEGSRPASSRVEAETSYGMNSSTANEILAQLASSPAQQSPVPKSIPSLPWNYFYSPTPQGGPTFQCQDPPTAGEFYKPRTAATALAEFGSPRAAQNGFLQQGQAGQGFPRDEAYLRAGAFGYPAIGMPDASPNVSSANSIAQNGGADPAATRKAAHESLASALYAQFGTARGNKQQSPSLDFSPVGGNPLRPEKSTPGISVSPAIPASPGNMRRAAANHMERPGSQLASSVSSLSGQQASLIDRQKSSDNTAAFPPQFGYHAPPYTASPGKSNLLGLAQPPPPENWENQNPLANSAGVPQNYMSWLGQGSPATRSSLAFSNPNSLFMGTPGGGGLPQPAPAPAPAPSHHAAAAAAAFAYGSRSPGQNNNNSRRESLAQMHHHLPNPLKGIIGEAAAAADDSYEYDRKVLQAAAMMDGNKQQQTRPNVK